MHDIGNGTWVGVLQRVMDLNIRNLIAPGEWSPGG